MAVNFLSTSEAKAKYDALKETYNNEDYFEVLQKSHHAHAAQKFSFPPLSFLQTPPIFGIHTLLHLHFQGGHNQISNFLRV
ncbi:hypothetical protein AAHA92_31432 [Salvia divinorum]|uniref:Uncharacterized protein n=1 Tax=Salvia divinorum TaxID=28513 RepID=A0ABD1FQA2_SALDI